MSEDSKAKTDPASKQRLHRGDIMSAATRSAVMAKIKGKGTKPELTVQRMLEKLGIQYESHARDLPGRPDFVVRSARVVILVDGDFWHGWRFEQWRLKLSEHWETKIAANRRRDARNRKLLRQSGWTIVRLWEHQVRDNPGRCRQRIRRAIGTLQLQAAPGSFPISASESDQGAS